MRLCGRHRVLSRVLNRLTLSTLDIALEEESLDLSVAVALVEPSLGGVVSFPLIFCSVWEYTATLTLSKILLIAD